MTGHVLFEQHYKGDLWRLEVTEHDGRTFGNWRKWFRQSADWKPTRQGVVIPLERLPDLHMALGAYLANDINSPLK